jgi:hypothetical protein
MKNLAFEGYNRINRFLNGLPPEAENPATTLSATNQPEPRKIKSLAEVFDDENAASLNTIAPKETPETAETSEHSPKLLSATEAAARKVRSLVEIFNKEAGEQTLSSDVDAKEPAHKWNINLEGMILLRQSITQ